MCMQNRAMPRNLTFRGLEKDDPVKKMENREKKRKTMIVVLCGELCLWIKCFKKQ